MPLIQWIMQNLEPRESVLVHPGLPPGATIPLVPITIIGADIIEIPSLTARDIEEIPRFGAAGRVMSPPNLSARKDRPPEITATRSVAPTVSTSAKTLSSASIASRSIGSTPSIRRRRS